MLPKEFKPAFIIIFSIVCLSILSELPLFSENKKGFIKPIDIFSEIRKREENNLLKSSLDAQIVENKLSSKEFTSLPTDSTLILDYGVDSNYSISNFFSKLDSSYLRTKKVRIAYFGDSFIEGDFVTDELRNSLQKRYGGHGIGFLPMQSIVSDEYRYINFKVKENWQEYNFQKNPSKFPLGLGGRIFFSTGTSTTELTAQKYDSLELVNLYTRKIANAEPTINISLDGKFSSITANNNNNVNETRLTKGSAVSKISLSTPITSFPIYGISIESKHGVFIDNFGFRGNTGIFTSQIAKEEFSDFNQYFQYDLIIIHYGLNAIEKGQTNFGWFENGLKKLIKKIKSSCPKTPILIVSTSDVAFKNLDGVFETDNSVLFMVNAQQRIAINEKIAFWNLFTAMGGKNTIAKWAEGSNQLAYKDYMHVTQKGAKKIADIFFNKLISSKIYYSNTKVRK